MVREAVFDILGERIREAAFLDLYCGSGAVAIEAVSRGAARAVACDASPKAVDHLKARNLARLPEWCQPKLKALRLALPERAPELARLGPFDVIFLDPPYLDVLPPIKLLRLLALEGAARPGAVAVWEQDRDACGKWSPETLKPWSLTSLRKWGKSRCAFLELPTDSGLGSGPQGGALIPEGGGDAGLGRP
jgi:16S rRNA (guanine(966)-N(2))-methyltransferase RsmD